MNGKNLGILGLIVAGIVLMLSGSVNAYNIQGGGVCECNSCDDCENALNDNVCTTVKLTSDITNHNGTCINNPTNFNNKTFDCQWHIIDGNNSGYGIYLHLKSGTTIKNCVIARFYCGIYLNSSSNNIITDNTVNDNYLGICLDSSSYNNALINNIANNNLNGILLLSSTYNNLTNNIVHSNIGHGIRLYSSSNNILINNTVYNNDKEYGIGNEGGISLYFSSNNTITHNTANNNEFGIWLYSSSNNIINSNCLCSNLQEDIHNNEYNYGTNTGDNNTCNTTYNWNDTDTTKCTYTCDITDTILGTTVISRIIRSTSIANTNSNTSTTTTTNCMCASCDECEAKISDPSCRVVVLTTNITNTNYEAHYTTNKACIYNPKNFNNKIFDCQGYTIDGGDGYGIYMKGRSGNTIKNCIITHSDIGIYLGFSLSNNLTNNTIYGSGRYGVWLDYSSNNVIANNNASNNFWAGIHLEASSNNNIMTNNILDNNGMIIAKMGSGLSLDTSAGTTNYINLNHMCSNAGFDIFNSTHNKNTGTNNICDKTNNWNDDETTGCTYTCDTCTCSFCDECTAKMNDQNCHVVVLITDITNHNGTCMDNPKNFNNKVFDCQGHTIDGDNSGTWSNLTHGICLNHKTGNTIKNCVITDFDDGIDLDYSLNNTITNNTVNNNWNNGISLFFSSNNALTNNIVSDNNHVGIYLNSSSNNLVNTNYLCLNRKYDIYNGLNCVNNTGNNNTGDIYYNWNDGGTIGFTHACPKCYVNDAGVCIIKTGQRCTCINRALNDTDCKEVKLNSSVINWRGTCLNNPKNFNSKIFDCQGYTIDGDDSGTDYGIYLYSKSGNTIKNCIITDFYEGIYLSSSTGNTVANNTVKNNNIGIYSQNSISMINKNIVCENAQLDFDSSDWLSTFGDNNTCDKADGWNDDNKTGCSYCGDRSIPKIYYWDLDGDGYGNLTNNITSCTPLTGYVNNNNDCNDNDLTINPSAKETAYGIDSKDNDCNGVIDECFPSNSPVNAQIYCNENYIMKYKKVFNEPCSANYECLSNNCTNGYCVGYVYYKDADNDGFGDSYNVSNIYVSLTNGGTTITHNGFNYTKIGGDCNDTISSINPNATDIPNNGIDENCNNYDNITCYPDLDNDGYTNNTNTIYNDNGTCLANYKKSITTQDCNDNDLTINPGAKETAYGIDSKDNDCNDVIDDCFPSNSPVNAQIYCNENYIMKYKKVFNEPCSANYECLSNNCTNGYCVGYLSHRNANATYLSGYANNSLASNRTTTVMPAVTKGSFSRNDTLNGINVMPKLILTCDPRVNINETLCCYVKDEEGNNVEGATITLTMPDGKKIPLISNANGKVCTNKTQLAGDVTAIASKEGYKNSSNITSKITAEGGFFMPLINIGPINIYINNNNFSIFINVGTFHINIPIHISLLSISFVSIFLYLIYRYLKKKKIYADDESIDKAIEEGKLEDIASKYSKIYVSRKVYDKIQGMNIEDKIKNKFEFMDLDEKGEEYLKECGNEHVARAKQLNVSILTANDETAKKAEENKINVKRYNEIKGRKFLSLSM